MGDHENVAEMTVQVEEANVEHTQSMNIIDGKLGAPNIFGTCISALHKVLKGSVNQLRFWRELLVIWRTTHGQLERG